MAQGVIPKPVRGKGLDLLAIATKLVLERADLAQRAGRTAEGEEETDAQIRRRLDLANARLAEARAAKEEGSSIPLDDAIRVLVTGWAAMKSRLEGLASSLASDLAATDDEAEVRIILLKAFKGLLSDVSSLFESFGTGLDPSFEDPEAEATKDS
ncbi:MAG: hypothetical protein AAGA68_26690 [Pseudomonadota bacterium]